MDIVVNQEAQRLRATLQQRGRGGARGGRGGARAAAAEAAGAL